MEKNNTKELPESVTLESEYAKYHSSWMAVLHNAQAAYDSLIADEDVGDCLPAFENLSIKWINDFVADKIAAVMSSPVPHASRMENVGLWRNLEKDITEKILKILALYDLDPEVKIELKGCHITIINMEEILREKTKFCIPESYRRYFEKISRVAEAVEDMRAYEQENKLPSLDVEVVLRFQTPDAFVGWRRSQAELAKYKGTGLFR